MHDPALWASWYVWLLAVPVLVIGTLIRELVSPAPSGPIAEAILNQRSRSIRFHFMHRSQTLRATEHVSPPHQSAPIPTESDVQQSLVASSSCHHRIVRLMPVQSI